MGGFVVIGAMLAIIAVPTASAAAKGDNKSFLRVDGRVSTPIHGTLDVAGTLHLNVVQNANGTTLHANFSNTTATTATTGNRYTCTGAQKVVIASGLREITLRLISECRTNARSKEDQMLRFGYDTGVTFDETGAIQSARLVGITEVR